MCGMACEGSHGVEILENFEIYIKSHDWKKPWKYKIKQNILWKNIMNTKNIFWIIEK